MCTGYFTDSVQLVLLSVRVSVKKRALQISALFGRCEKLPHKLIDVKFYYDFISLISSRPMVHIQGCVSLVDYEESPGGVWVVRQWQKMSFQCQIPLKK
jgi:hypothetical protein